MKKKSSLFKILSITFPILCIIAIIVGLFWMGTTKQRSFASINGFEKFKMTLVSVLDKANASAKDSNSNIIVCSIGNSNNSCGTDDDWVHGFIIYKGLKTNPKNIPSDQIIKTYPLKIVNTIVTEHDSLDMKPSGVLANTYHFIIKSENENLFPYQITVQPNSKLIIKLLDSN
jgi:uncharacterized protein YfkK (UPF0435 family)